MEDNKNTERNAYSPQNIFNIQMNINNNEALRKQEKINNFKNRIEAFNEISTLDEARKLAKTIMPVAQEINHFRVGDAKCVVVNKTNVFRISMDTENEFISYDFS